MVQNSVLTVNIYGHRYNSAAATAQPVMRDGKFSLICVCRLITACV